MNFIEKKDLNLKDDDKFLRTESTRKDNRYHSDISFTCYTINDDMYGPIVVNNGIPEWDLGIVIGFEI